MVSPLETLSNFNQLQSVGKKLANSSSNLRRLDTAAKAMRPDNDDSLFNDGSRSVTLTIKALAKCQSASVGTTVSAKAVATQTKTLTELSKKMTQVAEQSSGDSLAQQAATSVMSCLTRRVTRHVANRGKKELDQLAQDFEQVVQSFMTNMLPPSLLQRLEALSQFFENNASFDMDSALDKVRRFVTEFPKRVIEQELEKVDHMTRELLSRENLRKLATEHSDREQRNKVVRAEVRKLLQQLQSLRKTFESLVSRDFIDTVLRPLEVVMKTFSDLFQSLVDCIQQIPSVRDSMHELIKFLLSMDDRLLKVFRPPGLLMCLCACFLSIPEELERIRREVKMFKDATVTKWLMESVDALFNILGTGSNDIVHQASRITAAHHKMFGQLSTAIADQLTLFSELEKLDQEIEEQLLRVIDQIMDSAVGRAVDKVLDLKDKVVGWFG